MPSIDKRGQAWRARVRVPGFKRISRSFDTRDEADRWAQPRCFLNSMLSYL